ncbi:MAG: DUF1826 domain-containing protein [Bacteroidetes bacterium]|nr:DUF1826 domain-containing protein [Bacteroidota bacterium]
MLNKTLSTTGCLQSEDRAELRSIHESEYQAGLWRRVLPATLIEASLDLINSSWESFRFSGPAEELPAQLEQAGIHPLLKAEVLSQAEWFAALMDDQPLRLFFGKVHKDMCRRFHTDMNTLRLLCTYHGPGTLWVRPDAIDHQKVAKGTNEAMVKDPDGVFQAGTGEVLLIKGALHEQSQYGAALHRSPAVQQSGESRLLLRIDTGGAFNFS